MSERNEYAPGEFCWVDLGTTDGATRFYADLLGVEAEPAPGDPEETGGYGFFTKDGRMICGFGPTQQEGQPSAWSSYIKVDDADAIAERVKEADGNWFWARTETVRLATVEAPSSSVTVRVAVNVPVQG